MQLSHQVHLFFPRDIPPKALLPLAPIWSSCLHNQQLNLHSGAFPNCSEETMWLLWGPKCSFSKLEISYPVLSFMSPSSLLVCFHIPKLVSPNSQTWGVLMHKLASFIDIPKEALGFHIFQLSCFFDLLSNFQKFLRSQVCCHLPFHSFRSCAFTPF